MHTDTLRRLTGLVEEHENWRSQCLTLVAAENVASPLVKSFASSDLACRYGDFIGRDLKARKYFGTKYVVEVEQAVEKLAGEIFRAEYVEFRPLSGHIAGSATIMGLTQPGDAVLEVGSDGGGHRLAEKLTHASLADLKVEFLPIDGKSYNIDVSEAAEMIREKEPRLVILGSSNFLFPHPVAEVAEVLGEIQPKPVLIYDASHVLGFIATGQFQSPLMEGADLVLGSTHKTFPGPQGGIVYSNSKKLITRVAEAAYPGLITNHHLARIPALGVALEEIRQFGKEFMSQIVENARTLGRRLTDRGIRVVGADRDFTKSHTLLVSTDRFGENKEIASRLETGNIIVNAVSLPAEQGSQGLRLGVQELTRRGASGDDMRSVGDLIADLLREVIDPGEARIRVRSLTQRLPSLQYSFG